MSDCLSYVMKYPPLSERIGKRSDSRQEEEKIRDYVRDIRAEFSPFWINLVKSTLDYIYKRFYDGIIFNRGGLDLVKLCQDNFVILVPNHQSHMDYMAINYSFYKEVGRPLMVAGGENLNFFPIGKLFRKTGCFFIRRAFGSNVSYKMALEGYLYHLLKQGDPVEFFFEGGRSRSGKLLPPRYGIYSMLLNVYRHLEKEFPGKKMLFIPVSINHEHVPETKSLVRELRGGKKKKEGLGQFLKLFKLLPYHFGNIHITLGEPVVAPDPSSFGEHHSNVTNSLAFDCFREVGRNMTVTPSSLLSMILLDHPSRSLTLSDILYKSKIIRDYCHRYSIPYSKHLEGEGLDSTIKRTIRTFIGNKKVDVVEKYNSERICYYIRGECRAELLYLKNNILHHFLVPAIINLAWANLLWGELASVNDIKSFFLAQRKKLKHEFYLPTVKHFMYLTLRIVSDAIGREVESLDDIVNLEQKEVYDLKMNVGIFARSLDYIIGGYYLAASSVRQCVGSEGKLFTMGQYRETALDIFRREISSGRVIRYPESYSTDLIQRAMDYFKQSGMVALESDGEYRANGQEFDPLVDRYKKYLVGVAVFSI